MKPEIRLLQKADVKAVQALTKHIWEGDDYLGRVAGTWVKDGGFVGMFEAGKLLGCAKLTHLPDAVIWLEGLRVHPDYQGQGLGRLLSGIMLENARKLVTQGEARHIEFSTYYLNVESIHLSTQAGFKQIDEYYTISHDPVKASLPGRNYLIHEDIADYFPTVVPFGWKFLHTGRPALKWLNAKTCLLKAGGGRFYVGGDTPSVCLLSPAGEWIRKALPIMQYMVGKNRRIEIMLHASRQTELKTLEAMGFHWWEPDHNDRASVFRYLPKQ